MGCVYSHPGQNRGSSANKKRQPDYHPRPKPSQKTPNQQLTKTASLPPSEPPKPPSTPLKPPEEELPQFRRGNFDRNSVLRQSKKRSRKNSSASLNNSKALNSTLDQSVTNHVNHINEVTNGSKPSNALESRKSSYTSPKSNNENSTKIEVASDFLHEKQRNVYDAFEDNSHRFSTFGKAPESIRKESNTTTVSAIVNEENRKYSAKLNESSQFVNSFLNEKPSNNCTPEESSKSHRKESIEEMMIDSRKLSAIEERWKSSQRKTSNEEEQRKISSASANVAALLGKLSAPEDIKIDVWNNESSSESRNNLSITNGFSPTDLLEITTARDKTSPPRKSSEKQLPESRSTSRSRRSPAKEDCNPSSSSSSSTKAAEDLVEEDCGRLI